MPLIQYPDVVLMAHWYHLWKDKDKSIENILESEKVDLSRVIFLDLVRNDYLPNYFRNSNVGMFPNRIEGGTNLVLMEYIACGKLAKAHIPHTAIDPITMIRL